MPFRVFKNEKMENCIFINRDDFQVCSSVMIGHSLIEKGLNEMKLRGMFEAIASMSEFNKNYIELMKDNPYKLASFCYEQLTNAMIQGEDF